MTPATPCVNHSKRARWKAGVWYWQRKSQPLSLSLPAHPIIHEDLSIYTPLILLPICLATDNSDTLLFSLLCFNSGDVPTLTDLISFQGKTRHINIPGEITNWRYVGTALLNDIEGTIMEDLYQTNIVYQGDLREINLEILR